ncbi:MAG: recombinase family protein [Novosphingobium sp.]|nr:recombinase family protein [Novosphingobium sp.]
MKSCFGYIRVSTVKQGDGVSLEAQKEAIQVFASRNGITITQWFEEKETAAKRGRPIFNRMILSLRRRQADGLIVHKIDRFARNLIDYGKISELMDLGIDVYTAIESLDFQTRGGRLAADVQAVVAADFIRNQRQETIKGLSGRLNQGLYPFKAPVGYLDNGGGKPKTPDPERAPLVRVAFELYGSGQYSQRGLLPELHKRGLTNRDGRPLSLSGLETMLANPFYCGIIKIKRTGQVYQGRHEPLIPASLFDRVKDIKDNKAVKKMTVHNHTYRRLFRCQLCDDAMVPERQKGHVYYRCQTRECPTKTVREEAIETAILACLCRIHLTDDHIDQLVTQLDAWISDRNEVEGADALPLQLAAIESKRERLTDALIDRLISQETFHQRCEVLLLEEAGLNEKQARIEAQRTDPEQTRKFLELVKNLAFTYLFAAPQQKQQIARIATSNRSVIGKNVCIEPSIWLREVGHAVAALNGAPSACAGRTLTDALSGVAKKPEVLELLKLQDSQSRQHYR